MATYTTEIHLHYENESEQDKPFADYTLIVEMAGFRVLKLTPELVTFDFDPSEKSGLLGNISWNPEGVTCILQASGKGDGYRAIQKFPLDDSFFRVIKFWKQIHALTLVSP